MEAASADDFPEDAERKGIGTPATRAAIIEKLVLKGFLERKGSGKVKTLIPTEKGKALITVTPEQLQSPAMTADWEEKLSEVEHGEYAPETFMDEISGMIMELVNNYEIVKGAKVLMPGTTVIGTCPHCGAEVIERQKGWFCSNPRMPLHSLERQRLLQENWQTPHCSDGGTSGTGRKNPREGLQKPENRKDLQCFCSAVHRSRWTSEISAGI